jgi:hypothetical protein
VNNKTPSIESADRGLIEISQYHWIITEMAKTAMADIIKNS